MKIRSLIAACVFALSATAFASEDTSWMYEGKDLNKTPATLGNLLYERTELNKDTHGNTLAIGHLDRVKADKTYVDAQDAAIRKEVAMKVSQTEFVKDQKRQDDAVKNVNGRVDGVAQVQKDQGKVIEKHTGQIADLEKYRNEYGARLDNLDAAQTALDNRYASQLAGYQSEIASMKEDIEQAKEGNAVALAVAGQQFCTDRSCGGQVAVSAATISGKQAIAVGLGAAVTENVFVNAAFSKSGNTQGGVVSGTYRFK